MPKLVRSASEPCVNVSQSNFDDLDSFYYNATPKTPVHPPGAFSNAFSSTLKVL